MRRHGPDDARRLGSLLGAIRRPTDASGLSVVSRCTRPAWKAALAASVRDATPSLPRMFETWTPAVFSLMNSSVPIWRLVRPAATSWSTSSSRGREPEGPLRSTTLGRAGRAGPLTASQPDAELTADALQPGRHAAGRQARPRRRAQRAGHLKPPRRLLRPQPRGPVARPRTLPGTDCPRRPIDREARTTRPPRGRRRAVPLRHRWWPAPAPIRSPALPPGEPSWSRIDTASARRSRICATPSAAASREPAATAAADSARAAIRSASNRPSDGSPRNRDRASAATTRASAGRSCHRYSSTPASCGAGPVVLAAGSATMSSLAVAHAASASSAPEATNHGSA